MAKNVFLCHNSEDKPEVEKIRTELLQREIDAWLDKYDFEPFRLWQDQLEEIIGQIEAAAIFIGSSGVGHWADIEMKGFLVEFVKRKLRMGLVILPSCKYSLTELEEKTPRFLRGFHWVDFRQQDPDPMKQLIWGITGIRPESQPSQTVVQTQQPLERLNSHLGFQPKILASQPGDIIQPLTNIQPPTQTDNLRSEKCLDYSKLRDLLVAQNWEEADKETYEVMIKAVGKKSGDWFTIDELLNFPCQDLRTIDQLWVQYSEGRFGFSVQKEIYLSVGGRLGSYEPETFLRFYETAGWRGGIKYNTSTQGHLPNKVPIRVAVGGRTAMVEGQMPWGLVGISSLASKCVNCNI
ncbi:MAG: TIR domain-containing protein [Dolichospermum sp. JUN01]|nr:TIR domain-containing protein [Dolichospermum sp. JUN01]